MNKTTHLLIHHTEVDSKISQFPAVERYHKSKGFPISSLGFHVGYHYMIDTKGRVIKARLDSDEGAHTLLGWNQKSIGICLDGNFNEHPPTKEALISLRILIKDYNLPYLLHRDADTNRTCPGFYFTKELLETAIPRIPSPEEYQKQAEIKRQLSFIQILINALISFISKK